MGLTPWTLNLKRGDDLCDDDLRLRCGRQILGEGINLPRNDSPHFRLVIRQKRDKVHQQQTCTLIHAKNSLDLRID